MNNGGGRHTILGREEGFVSQVSHHDTQRVPVDRFILPSQLCDPHNRDAIANALQEDDAQIPEQFKPCYYNYQNVHHRFYLKQINLLGQLCFLFYFFADWFLLPDISFISGLSRVVAVLGFVILNMLMFKYCKNIVILDLLLPISSACGAAIWFWLLSQSHSPNVNQYQYASVIFVLLGCLSIRVRFRSAVLTALLISMVIIGGILSINNNQQVIIFLLVYIPILFFSLYVSWNNTLNARRAFLRSMLEEWDRHLLRELAHTDELTQLSNRRQFELIADKMIHAWPPYQSICLLMFDVDYFKRINDSYGHDIGDQVLQKIAELARKEMRRADVLARFGGEEFVALLPETTLEDAIMIAGRLRKNIESHPVCIGNDIKISFTVSVGVSKLNSDNINLHSLIKEADIALYRAKQNGRNQVASFDLPTI